MKEMYVYNIINIQMNGRQMILSTPQLQETGIALYDITSN